MKSKVILAIGILAIVIGVATTGIAIKSVQAATPDPGAIKNISSRQAQNTQFGAVVKEGISKGADLALTNG